jgi:hypothetical protein
MASVMDSSAASSAKAALDFGISAEAAIVLTNSVLFILILPLWFLHFQALMLDVSPQSPAPAFLFNSFLILIYTTD